MTSYNFSGKKIVLAAPPFCGHLHPILAIAKFLKELGADCVVATGPNKVITVNACGLDAFPILRDRPNVLEDIANTERRMTLNPFTMFRQASENIALIAPIRKEILSFYDDFNPDLVISDFTAFPANFAAEQLGIPHISVTPSPVAIEAQDGVPGYFGGWTPGDTRLHNLRDQVGRSLTRLAKKSFTLPFKKQLSNAGVELYRHDRSEAIYSRHSILGFGMKELEFPRSWPRQFKMIGPITFSPEKDLILNLKGLSPKPLVLVTAGTHVWWAKKTFLADTELLRATFPELYFVFSRGDSLNASTVPLEKNDQFAVFSYIPYDHHLNKFKAILHHGGTGVLYSCLSQGIPALARPLDYDQFDYASRLAYYNVGVSVKSYQSRKAILGLRRIIDDPESFATKHFQSLAASYDPMGAVASEVERLLNQ